MKAQAKALASRIHAAIAALFLDCQRGQISNHQQRDAGQPGDDEHCKHVLHTGFTKALPGPITATAVLWKSEQADFIVPSLKQAPSTSAKNVVSCPRVAVRDF